MHRAAGADVIEIKFTGFTDWPALKASFKRATKSVLDKAGAFVRTSARTSIRKRKHAAMPGAPPSSHIGRLRDLIFFSVDEDRSVIIGPMLSKTQSPTVPELLELGGKVKLKKKIARAATGRMASAAQKAAYRRKLLDGSLRSPSTQYEYVEATYRKFPFMKPALDANAPKFPELFTDSVK
jgi:hypothetical protein